MEEMVLLDTKRKCFGCLSPLKQPYYMLQNLEKLFSTLHLNYAEIIVKMAGGVQVERMILDGVANRFVVRLCNSCGASLEQVSKACEERYRRGEICKEIVQALEDEVKLDNFKKEKPSNLWGYFVETFVLNLRLELSKQCNILLGKHK